MFEPEKKALYQPVLPCAHRRGRVLKPILLSISHPGLSLYLDID
ncbi:Hypothetical protein Minf_1699 [Methylacidiphilum infernorum V4]|uniref:Uncharacterized protein n=1 Tax=Methylacidiphilum infernorum (isolate V4) TaxID=481448 RepID=B3DWU0_METI4|nr:Hypothetical protein Minf_1699 [Methylacidiphilum infernorum V4]